MCEYCAVSETWRKPVEGEGEDPPECEWSPDHDDIDIDIELTDPDELSGSFVSCESRATKIVYDRKAGGHLCEAHRRQEKLDMEEGLGEFLHEFGFQHPTEFLSINAEALCDYVGNLLSESVSRCGGPAAYVKVVTQEMVLCDKHSQETGLPSDGDQAP